MLLFQTELIEQRQLGSNLNAPITSALSSLENFQAAILLPQFAIPIVYDSVIPMIDMSQVQPVAYRFRFSKDPEIRKKYSELMRQFPFSEKWKKCSLLLI